MTVSHAAADHTHSTRMDLQPFALQPRMKIWAITSTLVARIRSDSRPHANYRQLIAVNTASDDAG